MPSRPQFGYLFNPVFEQTFSVRVVDADFIPSIVEHAHFCRSSVVNADIENSARLAEVNVAMQNTHTNGR